MKSQNPHETICLWASVIAINVSVAICQLPIHQLSSFGKRVYCLSLIPPELKLNFKCCLNIKCVKGTLTHLILFV